MNDLLAKNLAFLLDKERVDQTATAQIVGVSQGTISKWSTMYAKGESREPEFRGIARLAEHLSVPLADLIHRDLAKDGPSPPLSLPSPPPPSQPVRLDVSKLALLIEYMDNALLESGRVLDPDRRARIIALMYADPGIQNTREAVEAAMRGAFTTME